MDVQNLVDAIKNNKNDSMMIRVILPDNKEVGLSTQQYVIGGEYHVFAMTDACEAYSRQNTIGGLKSNLVYESQDECWRTRYNILEDGESDFLDCNVCVVTGNLDDYHSRINSGTYEIHEVYGSKYEKGIFYLICAEDEWLCDVEDDELDEETASTAMELKVAVEGGYLIARRSMDPNHPGIDVEFIPDVDISETLSNSRVLLEKPKGLPLTAFVWNNTSKEDYTLNIVFE